MRLFFKNEAKSLSSEFYPNQVWRFFKQALNERQVGIDTGHSLTGIEMEEMDETIMKPAITEQ